MSADHKRRFGRFLVVGTTGFAVDLGLFTLLLNGGIAGIVASRVWAFVAAAFTTWLLNRSYTFASARGQRKMWELVRYALATGFSGALNLCAYTVLVALLGSREPIPHLAFVLGVGVGLVSNYTLYSTVVFRGIGDR